MSLWGDSWFRTHCFRWRRFLSQAVWQLRGEVLLQDGQRAEGLSSFILSLLSVDMRLVASVAVQNINSVELLWGKPGKETVTVLGAQTASVSSRVDLREVSVLWGKTSALQTQLWWPSWSGRYCLLIPIPAMMVNILGTGRGSSEDLSPVLSPLCTCPGHSPQPSTSWTRPTSNPPASSLKAVPSLFSCLPCFLSGEPS